MAWAAGAGAVGGLAMTEEVDSRSQETCLWYSFPPFDHTRWKTKTASLHAQEIQRLSVRGPVVAEIVSVVWLAHKEIGFAFGFKVIDPELARAVNDGASGKRQSLAIFRPSDVRIETFCVAADLQVRAAALR